MSRPARQWNIDDVPVFLAVVDCRGVTTAAAQLGLSKSAVSKSLTRLEQALSVRLLERNSRNVRITSEGEAFYRHGLQIMEQVKEADAVMAGLISQPAGPLVVALPMAFSREIVAQHLTEFHQQYPRIELEIIITSHPVDIMRDQIDLAVVIGTLTDSELVVKMLYESKLLWVASPDYIRRHPPGETAADLRTHIQVCEKRYATSRFPLRVNEQKELINLGTDLMVVNDPIAVREAVIHGSGISLVPDQYCKQALQNGELVQVFRHVEVESSASVISAIYPSRRLISNKTRAFLDFLVQICGKI